MQTNLGFGQTFRGFPNSYGLNRDFDFFDVWVGIWDIGGIQATFAKHMTDI